MRRALVGLAMLALVAWCLAAGAQVAVNHGVIAGTVIDPTGTVITGVKITATDDSTGLHYEAISDCSGGYRLSVLAPGNYSVRFGMPGFRTETRIPVQVSPAQTTQLNSKLQLSQGADGGPVIEATGGPIVDGYITGAVRDGTGAVISGALVTATEDHTGRQYRTITDESGSYRFAVVTPGEYSVTYEARGFSTQTKLSVVVAPAVPIRLDILMAIGNTGGSVVETIDNYWENGTRRPGPEIKSTGSISGTVSDDRGVAIPTRITATEQPSLRRYQTTTDSDGVYRLSHLPAGYYCLDFEGAGPSSARSTAIEVRPRHVTEMDLRLSPMETVEVCSGSCMIQTSNLPADSAHQGTALRVYAHSNVVPAGSEAWVIVALTNTSRHSILIHPEEGESPTLGYQMHASGRCNCPGLLHRSEIGPGSGNAHTGLRRDKRHKLRIQPGQTVTERVDLTRMNLDQPGTYTIYAECPDISSAKQGEERKDQPLVRSNAIRVMLLESDKE